MLITSFNFYASFSPFCLDSHRAAHRAASQSLKTKITKTPRWAKQNTQTGCRTKIQPFLSTSELIPQCKANLIPPWPESCTKLHASHCFPYNLWMYNSALVHSQGLSKQAALLVIYLAYSSLCPKDNWEVLNIWPMANPNFDGLTYFQNSLLYEINEACNCSSPLAAHTGQSCVTSFGFLIFRSITSKWPFSISMFTIFG